MPIFGLWPLFDLMEFTDSVESEHMMNALVVDGFRGSFGGEESRGYS